MCVCVCVVVLGGGGVNVCMHIIKLCNNLKSAKKCWKLVSAQLLCERRLCSPLVHSCT